MERKKYSAYRLPPRKLGKSLFCLFLIYCAILGHGNLFKIERQINTTPCVAGTGGCGMKPEIANKETEIDLLTE